MANEQQDDAVPSQGQGYLLLRGLVVPVYKYKDFIIGRERSTCDIALSDERVSKRHSIISFRDGRYILQDLGSLNGTYINGERVENELVIMPGDELQIRPFTMLFIGPDETEMESMNEDLAVQIPRDATSHLSGKLDIINITDLIQLLNTTRLSGLLHVIDDKQAKAQMVFEHGEIVQASYAKKKAEQAVYAVMCIKDGSFDFVGGVTEDDTGEQIGKRTVSMLLEGARIIDERGEKEKTQPIDVAVAD